MIGTWQAGDRPPPASRVSVAGESGLWVDPAEIPSADDVERLGKALAAGWHGERDQLMAAVAAYSGLRWGEIAALTAAQLDTAARVIAVDRKVVEVAGHLYVKAPKNRKRRQTIYPRLTPAGYPLAERLTARIEQARTERLLVIRGEVEVARPPAPAPPEDAATPLAAATPTATGDRL